MFPMVYQYSCAYVDDEYDYQYLCLQWSISTRVHTLMMSMITSIYVSNGQSVVSTGVHTLMMSMIPSIYVPNGRSLLVCIR